MSVAQFLPGKWPIFIILTLEYAVLSYRLWKVRHQNQTLRVDRHLKPRESSVAVLFGSCLRTGGVAVSPLPLYIPCTHHDCGARYHLYITTRTPTAAELGGILLQLLGEDNRVWLFPLFR